MHLFLNFLMVAMQLTGNADKLREEGKSLEAINLYNQAIVEFQQEGNYSQMFAPLTGRFIAWEHLFNNTHDDIYAVFAQSDAISMKQIAQLHHLQNQQFLIEYLSAKAFILLKDYPKAENSFQEALNLYPLDNAEKGDWMIHLGNAMALNGKQDLGIKMMQSGIAQIQDHKKDLDPYLYNVWMSGAYLKLAKLTKSPDYLLKAKEIIDQDPQLKIRKEQLDAWIKQSKSS